MPDAMPNPTPDAIPGLRERLSWIDGAVFDGPRRYLLMRDDALMGALVRLPDDAARKQWLEAVADSVREHGGQSLRAYAAAPGNSPQALAERTAAAAADLGWGQWELETIPGRGGEPLLVLTVHSSPFAAGWLTAAAGAAAGQPVCAPLVGIFGALAEQVLGGPVEVRECRCAAQGDAEACRFEALRPPTP
jgi:hypothetical protein